MKCTGLKGGKIVILLSVCVVESSHSGQCLSDTGSALSPVTCYKNEEGNMGPVFE